MNDMKKLIVRIKYIVSALREIGQPHIGARVTYNGVPCVLTQGMADPLWNLQVLDTQEFYKKVPITECKLDTSLAGKWRAFRFHYNFYMVYWYSSDVYKPLRDSQGNPA